MVKKEIVLLVLGLILLPSVLGVEINLIKDSYYGKETLQADITGNFISLESGNVFIYGEGKAHSEAVLSGLIKDGNVYHFYAVLPDRAGNFSLRIEGVEYIKSGKLIDNVIDKSFKIVDNNSTVLSVNPGFIIAGGDEIFVNVMSYNGNMDVTATLSGGESKSVSLVDSMEEKIKFSVLGIEGTKTSLSVGEYDIPILFLKQQEVIKDVAKINIIPVNLIGTLDSQKDYSFKVVLENIGETNISEINLSSDLNVLIKPDLIESLGVGEKIVVDVTILKVGDAETVSGKLVIKFEDEVLNLPLSFKVGTSEEVIVEVKEKSSGGVSLNCGDLGGEICLDDKKCSEETIPSLDGPCCLGKCSEVSGFNWWAIGLLILVITGLAVGFYYKKIKKKQNPKSKEEVLNDKSERYKRKMGWRRDGEVSKRLEPV